MGMLTMDKFEFLPLNLPGRGTKNERAGASIPHAQVVCIENAGHLSPMERPGAVNEEIKNLIGLP